MRWFQRKQSHKQQLFDQCLDGTFCRIRIGQNSLTGYAQRDDEMRELLLLQTWTEQEDGGWGELSVRFRSSMIDEIEVLSEVPHLRGSNGECVSLADFAPVEKLFPNPTDAESWCERAAEFAQRRQYEGAIEGYSNAIELDPSHPQVWFCRGMAYFFVGEPELAARDYDHSIELDRENVFARIYRGLVRFTKLGDFAGAKDDFESAMTIDSAHPVAYEMYAQMLVTVQDPRFHNAVLAEELATAACELTNWADHGPLKTLAKTLAAQRNFSEALRIQELAHQYATSETLSLSEQTLELYRRCLAEDEEQT